MRIFRISIVLFFLFFGLHGNAQNFYGAVFGGLNGSQIDGDNLLGYDKLNGTVGAYVGYDTDSWADGMLELRYIGKGRVKHADIEAGDVDFFRVDLHYLEMPVYARMLMHKEMPLYFEPGLALGYLLSQNFFDAGGKLDESQVGKTFKKSELSGFLGVSYLHNDHVIVRMRWQASLLPIGKGENNDVLVSFLGVDRRNYSRLVEFSVGYQF